MVTDAQVRKLMREMEKTGVQRVAAQRSGMDEKTARRYLRSGKLPSEMKKAREWRTRPNPFEEDRGWLEERLERLPGLRTTTLFEALVRAKPGRYQQGRAPGSAEIFHLAQFARQLLRQVARPYIVGRAAKHKGRELRHVPGDVDDRAGGDRVGVGDAFTHSRLRQLIGNAIEDVRAGCGRCFLPLARIMGGVCRGQRGLYPLWCTGHLRLQRLPVIGIAQGVAARLRGRLNGAIDIVEQCR